MSFYPSPDPTKLREILKQNYAPEREPLSLTDSPNDSTAAYPMPGDPMAQGLFPTSQPMSWSSEPPHGLAIRHTQFSRATLYPSALALSDATNLEDTWSAEITPTQRSVSQTDMVRKDSTLDYCDPLSTMLPVSAPWNPVQTGAPSFGHAYERSPSRSDYSTSSHASFVHSSPYQASEAASHSADSPYIKLEESPDERRPRFHSLPLAVPFEQSMLVNPGNIYSSPQLSMQDTPSMEMAASPVKMEPADHGLQVYAQRPTAQRSRSLQDTRHSIHEDHAKRSYTSQSSSSSCKCQECGRVFQRHYNLKAHMETHDPRREHPHACYYSGCDRRFVRRTDLLRHQESVHLKSRNFACPRCNSAFARKDTLTRHMEDGCSKRYEVKKRSARALRASSSAAWTAR